MISRIDYAARPLVTCRHPALPPSSPLQTAASVSPEHERARAEIAATQLLQGSEGSYPNPQFVSSEACQSRLPGSLETSTFLLLWPAMAGTGAAGACRRGFSAAACPARGTRGTASAKRGACWPFGKLTEACGPRKTSRSGITSIDADSVSSASSATKLDLEADRKARAEHLQRQWNPGKPSS